VFAVHLDAYTPGCSRFCLFGCFDPGPPWHGGETCMSQLPSSCKAVISNLPSLRNYWPSGGSLVHFCCFCFRALSAILPFAVAFLSFCARLAFWIHVCLQSARQRNRYEGSERFSTSGERESSSFFFLCGSFYILYFHLSHVSSPLFIINLFIVRFRPGV
jgi:hypothetical protein